MNLKYIPALLGFSLLIATAPMASAVTDGENDYKMPLIQIAGDVNEAERRPLIVLGVVDDAANLAAYNAITTANATAVNAAQDDAMALDLVSANGCFPTEIIDKIIKSGDIGTAISCVLVSRQFNLLAMQYFANSLKGASIFYRNAIRGQDAHGRKFEKPHTENFHRAFKAFLSGVATTDSERENFILTQIYLKNFIISSTDSITPIDNKMGHPDNKDVVVTLSLEKLFSSLHELVNKPAIELNNMIKALAILKGPINNNTQSVESSITNCLLFLKKTNDKSFKEKMIKLIRLQTVNFPDHYPNTFRATNNKNMDFNLLKLFNKQEVKIGNIKNELEVLSLDCEKDISRMISLYYDNLFQLQLQKKLL